MTAIIPLKPVRILGQTTMVDFAPTSRYGHDGDAAVIRTQLLIENDQDDMSLPISFLSADPDESNRPVVRVKDEKREMTSKVIADADRQTFLDAAIATATAAGVAADVARESLTQVLDKTARHHKTYISIKKGQQILLEFVSRERVRPDANGTFTFATLAPLPQYQLATGGSIWLSVALPRPVAGLNLAVVSATEGYGKRQDDLNGRTLLTWQWQNDPLLSVAYKYA